MDSRTQNYPWPELKSLTAFGLAQFTDTLRANGCKYLMGAKAVPLSMPLADVTALDCSGYVCKAVFDLTNPHVRWPDGSQNIEQWVERSGYKPSALTDANDRDDVLRIGFLSAHDDATLNENHVWFVYNGVTFESCGSEGPTRRVLIAQSWWRYGRYFVLNRNGSGV